MTYQILKTKTNTIQHFNEMIDFICTIKEKGLIVSEKIKISYNLYSLRYANEDVVIYACGHDTILVLVKENEIRYGSVHRHKL